MGEMRVLCQQGDITVSWDPADAESVVKAREEFERQHDGYEFFNKAAGRGKRRVTKFQVDAGQVIAAPGVQTKKDKTQGTRQKAMAGGPNERLVVPRV